MTTVLEQQQTIPSLEGNPLVQRHTRQLRDLEEKLARAQAHRTQLGAEQEQLGQQVHGAAVQALLDGRQDAHAKDRVARLEQIGTAIQKADAEVAAMTDAHFLLQKIATGVRVQVEADVRAKREALAREVLAAMVPSLEQLITLNTRLCALTAETPGMLYLPAVPAVLETWLRFARETGGRR